VLEFSINSGQAIAGIWTLISIAISLIVSLSVGYVYPSFSWQFSVGLFFVLLLVMVLPAYLLVALWQITSKE
jgi:ABC-type glycerol-3-phosphate transport system permease component